MNKYLTIIAALFLTTALCSAQPKKASFQYGPWIQNVTETGFTVVFKTPEPTLAFVEVAPEDGSSMYNSELHRFYETVAGRRTSGTLHKIRVTGLEPGTAYRYRVTGKVALDDSYAYGTVWGPQLHMVEQISGIRTLDAKAPECRFSMINDIHAHTDRYKALVKGLKPEDMDFLVMNGDMASYVNSLDTMMKYTFGPAKELIQSVPSIYVRGNHESRGRQFDMVPRIFDSPTGEFYFQFRQGPCAFLVRDDSGLAAFHNRHAAVGCSKVDSDNLAHCFLLIDPDSGLCGNRGLRACLRDLSLSVIVVIQSKYSKKECS